MRGGGHSLACLRGASGRFSTHSGKCLHYTHRRCTLPLGLRLAGSWVLLFATAPKWVPLASLASYPYPPSPAGCSC